MLFLSLRWDAFSISAIGESNGKSQLSKYFQNSFTLERYDGLNWEGVYNFMKVKSDLKVIFCTFSYFILVGMWISNARIICRVFTNHDNWWNCFKHKMCFVIKWYWENILKITCTFLTTCTLNNTKLKAQQKEINTFDWMKVSHLALERRADSNQILWILLLLVSRAWHVKLF